MFFIFDLNKTWFFLENQSVDKDIRFFNVLLQYFLLF